MNRMSLVGNRANENHVESASVVEHPTEEAGFGRKRPGSGRRLRLGVQRIRPSLLLIRRDQRL